MLSTIVSAPNSEAKSAQEEQRFLHSLGERVKSQRARKGMTRKALSSAAGVSERHLANLEYGEGNASILVLDQVAQALQCPLVQLLGDVTTQSPEWLLIREQLQGASDATLRKVRTHIGQMLKSDRDSSATQATLAASRRIALIGLRGAGKSTLGHMLAKDLGFPFLELSREIERIAGCTVAEIQALYGANAYRRYERRALEEAAQKNAEIVLAIPGGLVSDPATFNLLLDNCTTIWLQATPADHMQRVMAQGDMRPMAASKEAMQDLTAILDSRSAYYSKADFSLDTSAQSQAASFEQLRKITRGALKLPV
jgi:XRE family transcriptional regulator, aerobic/anaerobic benzoate catabolism transcriptional regulator